MNGCYSLFSVAMMTAACASARHAPPRIADRAPPKTSHQAEPAGTAAVPIEPHALAIDDPDERALRELRLAKGLFETFIAKAGSDPKYEDAVRRSRDRVEDIDVELKFLADGIASRSRQGPEF